MIFYIKVNLLYVFNNIIFLLIISSCLILMTLLLHLPIINNFRITLNNNEFIVTINCLLRLIIRADPYFFWIFFISSLICSFILLLDCFCQKYVPSLLPDPIKFSLFYMLIFFLPSYHELTKQ